MIIHYPFANLTSLIIYVLITHILVLKSHSINAESSVTTANTIHIAAIACGDKAIKHFPSFAGSLLSNPSSHRIILNLFVDPYFDEYLQSNVTMKRLTKHLNISVSSLRQLEILSQNVPDNLISPLQNLPRFQCAYLKMFLSNLVRFQKLLYVDIDTLALEDLSHVWDLLRRFTPKQVMGMVLENATPGEGYYHQISKKKHVYKGDGLNSGVILMYVCRMTTTIYHYSYSLSINLVSYIFSYYFSV